MSAHLPCQPTCLVSSPALLATCLVSLPALLATCLVRLPALFVPITNTLVLLKSMFNKLIHLEHRYLRKVYCSIFVMCWLLALAIPRVFLAAATNSTNKTNMPLISLYFKIFDLQLMKLFTLDV